MNYIVISLIETVNLASHRIGLSGDFGSYLYDTLISGICY